MSYPMGDPDAVGRFAVVYADPLWTPATPARRVERVVVNLGIDPGDEDDGAERRDWALTVAAIERMAEAGDPEHRFAPWRT